MKKILILGGTGEANRLVPEILARFGSAVSITTSLAGRTRAPTTPIGRVRIGGFGGAVGLREYLEKEAIDLVVDATHPFARQISDNAVTACAGAYAGTAPDRHLPAPHSNPAIQRLALTRPAWHPEHSDDWRMVQSLEDAATLLPRVGKTAFLTVGSQELDAFKSVEGVAFAIRMIDRPDADNPNVNPAPAIETTANTILILGKGPFNLEDEKALLETHKIDVLVTKNSGGDATYAKLLAARQAGIPVIMVERPTPPPGPIASTIEQALDWIAQQF